MRSRRRPLPVCWLGWGFNSTGASQTRYTWTYLFPLERVYSDLDAMLDTVRPEAVCAFGPIYDQLRVVEACAPRKIHVMVEKPLAVSLEHAERMAALARGHGIYLITNYETTWYASTYAAYRMAV